jgi:hypothetical protein
MAYEELIIRDQWRTGEGDLVSDEVIDHAMAMRAQQLQDLRYGDEPGQTHPDFELIINGTYTSDAPWLLGEGVNVMSPTKSMRIRIALGRLPVLRWIAPQIITENDIWTLDEAS